MPTYEYACTACGHGLEAVQSFSDDPLTDCPACGGLLRKVYAPVGIVLKGSGFYKTDSRAAAKGSGKSGSGASGGESSGASESASSSKESTSGGPASDKDKKKDSTPAASSAS